MCLSFFPPLSHLLIPYLGSGSSRTSGALGQWTNKRRREENNNGDDEEDNDATSESAMQTKTPKCVFTLDHVHHLNISPFHDQPKQSPVATPSVCIIHASCECVASVCFFLSFRFQASQIRHGRRNDRFWRGQAQAREPAQDSFPGQQGPAILLDAASGLSLGKQGPARRPAGEHAHCCAAAVDQAASTLRECYKNPSLSFLFCFLFFTQICATTHSFFCFFFVHCLRI